MGGAAQILWGVYRWLPLGFLVDFVVVGTLMRVSIARRRRHSSGKSASS